jgi:acylphosphatase
MTRMSVVAVRIVVTGRVQGVGFRWHVRETARRESLAGWVRNLPDGSVELVARGDPGSVQRLESSVRTGPPGSRVESVSVEPWQVDGSLPYPFTVMK